MAKKLIVIVFTSLVVLSCNKNFEETTLNEANINTNSLKEQISLSNISAETFKIGDNVLGLAQTNSFRQNVYKEIDKKFDGDDNVLIRDLFTSLSDQSSKNILKDLG